MDTPGSSRGKDPAETVYAKRLVLRLLMLVPIVQYEASKSF
jgi:hypothetical protein